MIFWIYYADRLITRKTPPSTSHTIMMEEEGIVVSGYMYDRIPRGVIEFVTNGQFVRISSTGAADGFIPQLIYKLAEEKFPGYPIKESTY